MPRNALSNRQRRALARAKPKPPRAVPAPALTVVTPIEPQGMAAREEVRDLVAQSEANRLGDEADVALPDDSGLAGFIWAAGRDGLVLLYRSKALSAPQLKAGIAYRLALAGAVPSLGSCLGRAGEGASAARWGEPPRVAMGQDGKLKAVRSAAELHRAYLQVRLNQMERAVGQVIADGRELHALRAIAGEGRTVREVAGAGGSASVAYREALKRALDAIMQVLANHGTVSS